MTTASTSVRRRDPRMTLFPIILTVIMATVGLCQRADAGEAGDSAKNPLSEAPLPLSDIQMVVDSAVSQCERANEDADFGIASVEDWCTIRAWSALGKEYPALAELALEQQAKQAELAGQLNEARKTRDRYRERNEQLTVELGKQQAQLGRQHPKWVTYAAGAAALLVGGGAGYLVGQITP